MSEILTVLKRNGPRGFTPWGWYLVFKALLEKGPEVLAEAEKEFAHYGERIKRKMREGYATLAAELAGNPRHAERSRRLFEFGKIVGLITEPEETEKQKRRNR